MKLRIVKSQGTVSFELGAQPVGLSRLQVLDSHGVTMWDLVPLSARAVPIHAADMAFVELPQSSAGAVLEALRRAVQDLNAADEQTEQAANPIVALSDLIAARQQGGELSDQTATAALEALRELEHSWKEVGGAPGQLATREAKQWVTGSRSPWAGVSRVSYGEIPNGYRQVQEPRPLTRGEKYCVVVFGEEVFDLGRDFFVA